MALASYSPRPSKSCADRNLSGSNRLKVVKSPKSSQEVVCRLPEPEKSPLPPKIQFLLTFQRAYSLITFMMVGLTLATYAWTVYSPKMWSSEYRKLRDLQRHERYLTTTNETLKNQIANQAEQSNSGLSKINPQHNVFITVQPSLTTLPSPQETLKPHPLIIGPLHTKSA